MKQVLNTSTSTHLRPQQILVSRMLEATSEELDKLINEEMEKNIVLEKNEDSAAAESPESDSAITNSDETDASETFEADTQEYAQETQMMLERNTADDEYDYGDDAIGMNANRSADDTYYSPLMNYSNELSFREDLKTQVGMLDLSEQEQFLANYIIDSLDDSGYLTKPLHELTDELAFYQQVDTTDECLLHILTDVVQKLEPTGIGARDLRECVLLQLQEKAEQQTTETPGAILQTAISIVESSFEDFAKRRYEKLCLRYAISAEQLEIITRLIASLNPRPAGVAVEMDNSRSRALHITPDFVVQNEDGTLSVTLNDSRTPSVQISAESAQMLETLQQETTPKADHQQAIVMLREHINNARQFISALRQRQQTMLKVMQTIVTMQYDYFLTGDYDQLRPMVLREVAERADYDIATISRVCNGKTVETDFGIVSLKELFSNAVEVNEGEEVSTTIIKQILKECMDNEDKQHPLTDEALAAILSEKGYPIARRTVAKYREQMGYNRARLRREL